MHESTNHFNRRFDKLKGYLPAVLGLIYGLLLLLELAYEKHPHFAFEGWFGFYPLVGFATTSLLVLIGRGIGFILRRKEDYYDA